MAREKLIIRILIIFVIGISFCFTAGGYTADAVASEKGEILYKKHCEVCHGEKGEGDGPAAHFLFPKPRVLTDGLFKVRSTPSGEPPTDKDILVIIKNGMPGSAMPSLSELSEEEYERMKCWECHGDKGKGDGPKAKDLNDDWKYPAPPNAFTVGIYKGGGTPSDVYLRFTAGMDGSPMPSYEGSLNDEERWALVFYTLSLAGEEVAKQPTSGQVTAKRISGNVPDRPDDSLWGQATQFKIPLMLLWQKPDSIQRVIHVRALYNDRDIAFLVEWEDATKNSVLDLDLFRDGAALQFPVKKGMKPPFWMGEDRKREGAVNIWFWKADAQELIDTGMRSSRQGPVENLVAGGFGTLTLKGKAQQKVLGKGKWKNRTWSVVFRRTLNGSEDSATFTRGRLTPVSFAIWDGGEGDVGGRKAVSTWYYIVPERL
jgi:DMSO reductase family type II enzyme heme b subunit